MSKNIDQLYTNALKAVSPQKQKAGQKARKACSQAFFDAYLRAALWSSTDESTESGGEPLDANYTVDDFTAKSIRKAKKDCNAFCDYAREELAAIPANDEQNGHDFWLTRNEHGAGFWDRGYEEKLADTLTEKAHSFGEVNIFVGRGGKLHYEG